MPLKPEPVDFSVLTRLAAIDARCDWSIRRGTHRGTRVYWVRVWERAALPVAEFERPTGAVSFYRWTLADSLLGVALAAEERGWHRPI